MTSSESSIDLLAALDALDQTLNQNPDPEAYYQRGRIHAKLNHIADAIADYSKSIRFRPTGAAFLQRGMLYLSEGNPGAAIADAQRALQLEKSAAAFQLLGKAYAQQAKFADAIAAYKQAAQSHLDRADKENARLCLDQIQALQALESEKRSSLIALPAPRQFTFDPVSTADFLQKVRSKIEQGNYQEAQFDLTWLLNLEPNQIEALCLLGQVQAKRGNATAAIATITKAQKLDPQNAAIKVQRAIVRSLIGDATGAIADFTTLIREDTSNAELYLQRAQAHGRTGDWENAFKDYSNAIGIAPENPAAYFARASVQQEMGELEGSIADYQQAASIWFDRGDAENHQKAIAQANSLRDTKKAKDAVEAAIIRVPIKYRIGGFPVVEAVFNGQYPFDVAIDPGAGRSIITQKMAYALNITPTGRAWGRLSDGRSIELESGLVRSIDVGGAIAQNLEVMIAPSEVEAMLGQDFLNGYRVRLLPNEVEFYR